MVDCYYAMSYLLAILSKIPTIPHNVNNILSPPEQLLPLPLYKFESKKFNCFWINHFLSHGWDHNGNFGSSNIAQETAQCADDTSIRYSRDKFDHELLFVKVKACSLMCSSPKRFNILILCFCSLLKDVSVECMWSHLFQPFTKYGHTIIIDCNSPPSFWDESWTPSFTGPIES